MANASALYRPGCAKDVSIVPLTGVACDCSGIAVQEELQNVALNFRRKQGSLVLARHPPVPILAAQLNLVPFYSSFGFAVMSEPYDDFGVIHVEMSMRLGG